MLYPQHPHIHLPLVFTFPMFNINKKGQHFYHPFFSNIIIFQFINIQYSADIQYLY